MSIWFCHLTDDMPGRLMKLEGIRSLLLIHCLGCSPNVTYVTQLIGFNYSRKKTIARITVASDGQKCMLFFLLAGRALKKFQTDTIPNRKYYLLNTSLSRPIGMWTTQGVFCGSPSGIYLQYDFINACVTVYHSKVFAQFLDIFHCRSHNGTERSQYKIGIKKLKSRFKCKSFFFLHTLNIYPFHFYLRQFIYAFHKVIQLFRCL